MRPCIQVVKLRAVWLATMLTLCGSVVADDFRVFTAVHDLSQESEGKQPAVRAMTLFHAGKVYDYVDAASEVIIFEPTARQFRILNTKHGIVTTAALDEIKQLLKVPKEATEEQLARLSQNDPNARDAIALLQFQLNPQFETSLDAETGLLTLASEPIRYEVRTVKPDQPSLVETYLEYTDWVCRLNYLLHPGPLLPEPRLALNRQLRENGLLPKTVELRADAMALHLRADHEVSFDLNSAERSWIFQWEARLRDPSTKTVPLQEYQRTVLMALRK